MNTQTALLILSAATAPLLTADARDWPKWLGPDGNNSIEGAAIDLSRFSEAWTTNVGAGYSAIVEADGRAFTIGHDTKSSETVYCFDAATGKEIWHYTYDAELLPRMHSGGPNATPTVVGDTVFTISKDGQAIAFNAATGDVKWKKDLAASMDIEVPQWGFGSSPVVDGDRLYASAAKVVALNARSGEAHWTSSNSNGPAYATPVPFSKDGKRFLVNMDSDGVSIVNATDGSETARHAFKSDFNLNATTPEVLEGGNLVFVSGNKSSEMFKFDGTSLTSVWSSKDIKNAMNNSVIHDGVIYGIDGKQGQRSARFVAVDAKSGERIWEQDEFGFANVIGVGDTILALTEKGDLVTVKRSKAGYSETSRKTVLGDTCWTTPVYANGRIYVRNNVGKVICLSEK